MTDQTIGRITVAMAGLFVLVVALIFLTARPGPMAAPSVSPPSAIAASDLASDGASVEPTTAASASAGPSASAAPGDADGPASFTVVGLKLDASDDPAGQERIITFTSDQPGEIVVNLKSQTPQGTTHMCLFQGSSEVGCEDWSAGTFTRTTSQSSVEWRVTLVGEGIDTPIVEVTATFPSASAAVTIEHARFDGTAFPDTNGIQVRFPVRKDGDVRLQASWGGHPFAYEVTLANETTGTTEERPGSIPSIGLDLTSIPAQAGSNTLTLRNADAGFGTTDLTVSVGWP